MKKIVKAASSFAIATVATCGLVCAVASAANPNYISGKYAYMSGVVEGSPKDKGIVAVKNTSSVTRHVKITSSVLGNTSGAVASGDWIRKSKENAGSFSAKAVIRKTKDPSSAKLETLNLTVN